MNSDSDIEVFAEELKLIRDNVHGRLKQNSEIELTHSEVISFARAFIAATETGTIKPFSDWRHEYQNKVMFFMNLMRTRGILHSDRSRAAKKCLKIILEAEEKKNPGDTQNNVEDWDTIPF